MKNKKILTFIHSLEMQDN